MDTNTLALLGEWAVYASVVLGALSILFELVELVFLLTPTDKDDKLLAKFKPLWEKVRTYLKWISVKTPLTKVFDKILAGIKLLKGFAVEYKNRRLEKKAVKAKSKQK